MAESNADADKEAIRSWFKALLDAVVKEMLKIKAVTGAAVEATPMWMVPHQILIAKVWGAGQKSRFIWTISGDRAITDHIAGSLAATPQEAARHFSLKWQMDADRLLELAKTRGPVENTEAHMRAYTNKLIQDAEALYDLVCQDEVWLSKTE